MTVILQDDDTVLLHSDGIRQADHPSGGECGTTAEDDLTLVVVCKKPESVGH